MSYTRKKMLSDWTSKVVYAQQFYPYDTSSRPNKVKTFEKRAKQNDWKDWENYLVAQKLLGEVPWETFIQSIKKFLAWAEKTTELVEPWLIAHSYSQITIAFSEIDDESSAVETLNKLIAQYNTSNDVEIQSTIARALSNVGVMYANNKNFTKAFDYMNRVVRNYKQYKNINTNIAVATALLNIGILSGEIKDNSETEYYQKIIAEYGDTKNCWLQSLIVQAMFNLGVSFQDDGEQEKAIEQWTSIYDKYKNSPIEEVQVTIAEALGNIGLTYSEMEEPEKEIETYNLIIENYGSHTEPSIQETVSLARRYKRLSLLDMGKEEESEQVLKDTIENARGTDNQTVQRLTLRETLSGVIDRFSEEKEDFLKKMDNRKVKIDEFLEKNSRFEKTNSLLFVLRQWNSFTPIIANGSESDRGGGYFIFHNRLGIVIDPGYDFIEHFHHMGGRVHDITHIAITHAHDDHTAQLEQLLTMFHQYNKVGKKKKITLLLNHSTLKKFSGFRLHKDCEYIDKVICLNSFDPTSHQRINLSSQCSISVLPAYHDDVFTEEYAVGLGFQFKFPGKKTRKIVLTGDTGLFPPKRGIDNKIKKFDNPPYEGITMVREDEPSLALHKNYPKEFCKKPDLLIPHIGSIQRYEFDPSRSPNEPMFYANHLGLLGTATMIHELDPVATIVSEFGSELKDLRMQIVEFLRIGLQKMRETEDKMFIIPGDTSIVYNIDKGQFLRHDDCSFHPNDEIEAKEVEPKQIGLFPYNALALSLERFRNTLSFHRGEDFRKEELCCLPYFKRN